MILLRNAYAAALQLIRTQLGLSQLDIAATVTPSHVSQLEAAKTSATLEVSQQLALAMKLHPVSFLALIHAAQDQKTVREILKLALQELDAVDLLDVAIPAQPEKLPHPRTKVAEKSRESVQALKNLGHTQAEVVQMLGMPKSTVGRHWHRTEKS